MRTIISRYDGWCSTCHGKFSAGDPILWEPGVKPKHTDVEVCKANLRSQLAKPQAPVAKISVEDSGVYVLPNGDIIKVKVNQAKTSTYPLRWVESPLRALEAGGRVRGDYQYEDDYAKRRALVSELVATGRKMTLDEAKAFIVKYGQCARCSRHLVAAESVERGIGPVCVKYFSSGVSGASVLTGAVA